MVSTPTRPPVPCPSTGGWHTHCSISLHSHPDSLISWEPMFPQNGNSATTDLARAVPVQELTPPTQHIACHCGFSLARENEEVVNVSHVFLWWQPHNGLCLPGPGHEYSTTKWARRCRRRSAVGGALSNVSQSKFCYLLLKIVIVVVVVVSNTNNNNSIVN